MDSEELHLMAQPMIEVVAMPQRSEIRSGNEDWTGVSSTAMRRRLQNRLNQRAARKRRQMASSSDGVAFHSTDLAVAQSFARAVKVFPRPTPSSGICMHPSRRQFVTDAPDFRSFVRTPLPADHYLLTLLHFNIVRALTRNAYLLGLDPDSMHDDILSPFSLAAEAPLSLHAIPPTLHPTRLQMTVPHHPEIDIFPFPAYRDNLICAGVAVDDTELCLDVLYGVEPDVKQSSNTKQLVRDCKDVGAGGGGRTGLIVWGDPWLQSSWEVEEGFARKYKNLLKGCDALLRSTNFWREQRGEEPLVLD